jgi:hypothetical protein
MQRKKPELNKILEFKNAQKIKYDVLFGKMYYKDRSGDCDDPDVNEPKIRIDSAQKEFDLMSTAIEEVLHAHDFTLTEKVVRKCADNTAELLYKLGFRKIKNEGLDKGRQAQYHD